MINDIYEKYKKDKYDTFDSLYESFVLMLRIDGRSKSMENLKSLKDNFYKGDDETQNKLFHLIIKEINDYLDYKKKARIKFTIKI